MRDIGFTPRVAASVQFEEIKSVLRGSIEQRARQAAGPLGHADRAVHRRGRRSMRSMRCSPICWSCGATSARTASPALRPPSSPARRLRAACSCRISGRVFGRRTSVLLTGTLRQRRGAGDHRSRAARSGWSSRFSRLWALMFAAVTPVRQSYLNAPHRVEATRDRVVVRLAARIERRRGDPATSRQRRRTSGATRLPI